jgi:hypothetical protein
MALTQMANADSTILRGMGESLMAKAPVDSQSLAVLR